MQQCESRIVMHTMSGGGYDDTTAADVTVTIRDNDHSGSGSDVLKPRALEIVQNSLARTIR